MWSCLLLTFCLLASLINADKCPPGTIRPLNSYFCYSFNSNLFDFFGAESECDLQGGHLAYIDSAFTNAALGTQAKNLSWDQYWIGANQIKLTANDVIVKMWAWAGTDRYLKFSDWYVNEPNPNNNCAVGKTSDFTWISTDCAVKKPFICSIPMKIVVCDDGWTYFTETNSCYKVFYNKTWDDAENYCQTQSAHLTSIHSKDENDFVYDLAKSGELLVSFVNCTWIGLYTKSVDTSDISAYKWSDDSATNYYNWWYVGQPDNDNEHCVHMFAGPSKKFTPYTWNNYPCYYVFRNFVCKKLANPVHC